MLDEVDIYLQSFVICETKQLFLAHAACEWLCTVSKDNLYQFISKMVSKTRNAPDYIQNKYTK